jgi:hypothetical protein
MTLKLSTVALIVGSLAIGAHALADCPGPFASDARRAYEKARAYEQQGKSEAALRLYAQAEGYVCENVNPYEADAAKRAAPLGLTAGGAAEKRNDLQTAFDLYEAGGHFAQADRVLMAITRARADEPFAYQKAREHFDDRSLEAFAINHAAALRVTGPYRPDPKLIAEVTAMPAKGVERAAQRESNAFNEQYLRDYVQLIQSRADDLTDANAIQRTISAQQAFAQKWQQQEPMKASHEALELMRSWASASNDAQLIKQTNAEIARRAEQHAQLLAQKYSGAPKLLEDAMDFVSVQHLEEANREARIAGLRAQAAKLGDAASAKNRYVLAAEYYDAARDTAKAKAMRDKQSQLAHQKMQPKIDEAQRQAAELQKAFSDPAQVQAMREQAEAAKRRLQQQQTPAVKAANKKKADDLEKELGL